MANPHSTNQSDKAKSLYRHPDAAALLANDTHIPYSEEEKNAFFLGFLTYANEEEEFLTFKSYSLSRGVNPETSKKWHEKSPKLKRYYQIGMAVLAEKRQRLAEKKEMDKELFLRHQHMYDKDYDELVNKYHQKLKEIEALQEKVQILLNSMPVTGRVISKEEKKKKYEAQRGIENNPR